MMRDLFLALRDQHNSRRHPLLRGMLYAFCPRAVWWWQTGVEPEPPPDPLASALDALAAGQTLKEALVDREVDTRLFEDVQQYVRDVEAFRARRTGIPSPETTLFFIQEYDKLTPGNRFDIKIDLDQFGGSWRDFYEFVRTFAFLYEDWVADFNMPQTASLDAILLSLSLRNNGEIGPIRWPAWIWQHGPREVVTALAPPTSRERVIGADQDSLRLTLFTYADRVDGRWSGTPEVWMLDRLGHATPFQPVASADNISTTIMGLHEHANSGPYPPLGALGSPKRCHGCGFRAVCWDSDGQRLRDDFVADGSNDQ